MADLVALILEKSVLCLMLETFDFALTLLDAVVLAVVGVLALVITDPLGLKVEIFFFSAELLLIPILTTPISI